MLRIISQLPQEIEQLIEVVIGCAVKVHRILGPGFFEPVYHRALRIELEDAGVSFE